MYNLLINDHVPCISVGEQQENLQENAFVELLQDNNINIVDNPGDGDCLTYALQKIANINNIRTEIGQWMRVRFFFSSCSRHFAYHVSI
jgi:hypothetical protein